MLLVQTLLQTVQPQHATGDISTANPIYPNPFTSIDKY
jgi:hypothetical protein